MFLCGNTIHETLFLITFTQVLFYFLFEFSDY